MTAHDMLPADKLREAAFESIKYRGEDPLEALIPGGGEATAEALALVKFITGRAIAQGPVSAPVARISLRKWARAEATQ